MRTLGQARTGSSSVDKVEEKDQNCRHYSNENLHGSLDFLLSNCFEKLFREDSTSGHLSFLAQTVQGIP